jgi:hypothetical protein
MTRRLIIGVVIGLALSGTSVAQNVAVEAFPEQKVFQRFLADGLAHQMSLNRVTDNREWLGAIGGIIPFAEVRIDDIRIQAGVGATTFNRLIKTPGHITVYTIDYKVDFPFDIRSGDWSFRTGYGHLSSHYADDGIEILKRSSISYVRDYWNFGAAYAVPATGITAYVSADWNFHFEPVADKWIVQLGIQGTITRLAPWCELYAAVDCKLRENLGWGTTQSYQIGGRMFEKGRMAIRLAYTYRTGFEERGQLFDQKVDMNLLGVYLDF